MIFCFHPTAEMITVIARDLEGGSNYRTLEEMEEALGPPTCSGGRTAPTW